MSQKRVMFTVLVIDICSKMAVTLFGIRLFLQKPSHYFHSFCLTTKRVSSPLLLKTSLFICLLNLLRQFVFPFSHFPFC